MGEGGGGGGGGGGYLKSRGTACVIITVGWCRSWV